MIFKRYTAILVLLTAVFGCTIQENPMDGIKSGLMELSVELPSFEMQTRASEAVPQLYAYPIPSDFSTAIQPLPPENYVNGAYYYSIPDNTKDIFFSNIGAASDLCNISFPAPDAVLRVESKPDSLVGTDILYGKITSYSPDATKYSVTLKRAVAKLKITLQVRTDEDTISNLTTRFDSVKVRIGDIYTSVDMTPSLDTAYAGSGSFTAVLDILQDGCYVDDLLTFPSLAHNPPIELSIKLKNGVTMKFASMLPKKINSNRYYDITLSLFQNNADVGFILDEIDVKDMNANYWEDQFNLIEFSDSRLFFGESANISKEITITKSLLGTWLAEIPEETLKSFSVKNKTTGMTATSSNPVISGSQGDVVEVTTLISNAGNAESLPGEIRFRPENNPNVYPLNMIQSNGMAQTVVVSSLNQYRLNVHGIDLNFSRVEPDGSKTEVETGDYIYQEQIPQGTYEISGPFITYFSISDTDIESIRFENCNTVSEVYIGARSFQCDRLDLLGLISLESCNISSDQNKQMELFLPQEKTRLESLYLDRILFETLDLEDYTALTRLNIHENSALKNINLRNCNSLVNVYGVFSGSIETIDISNTALSSLNLYSLSSLTSLTAADCKSLKLLKLQDNFSSLNTFNISGSSLETISFINLRLPLNVLDFSAIPTLDSLYVSSYNSTEFPLSQLNLSGCTNLRSVELSNLHSLEGVNVSNSNLRKLHISDCGMLSILDLSQVPIENLQVQACSTLVSIIPNNQTITGVEITSCDNLQELNLTNNTSLNYLSISNNTVPSYPTEMPNIEGCTGLRTLHLQSVGKSSLELSSSAALESIEIFECSNVQTLNCSGLSNLESVTIRNTQPVIMDFSGCISLDILSLSDQNRLETLNLSGMQSLRSLMLNNSGVQELALDNASSLEFLYVNWNNKLKTISIAENNKLKHVQLTYNQTLPFSNVHLNAPNTLQKLKIYECSRTDVTDEQSVLNLQGYVALRLMQVQRCYNLNTINIGGCSALECLDVSYSGIAAIDLNGADALNILDMEGSRLETATINGIFQGLPVRSSTDIGKYCLNGAYSPSGNLEPDVNLLKDKGWYVLTNISDINFENN